MKNYTWAKQQLIRTFYSLYFMVCFGLTTVPIISNPINGECAEFFSQPLQTLSGVPLGGIGTGKIEIFPNGRFGQFTTNNNPDRPITNTEGCFAALSISSPSRSLTKVLYQDRSDSMGIESVSLAGGYPSTHVSFYDRELPVSVSLHAFNPQAPGEVERSCYPTVVFEYTLKNKTATPQTISLAMSWTNLSGIGAIPQEMFAPGGECVHRETRKGRWHGIELQFQPGESSTIHSPALGSFGLFAKEDESVKISSQPMWDTMLSPHLFWEPLKRNQPFQPTNQSASLNVTAKEARPSGAVAAHTVLKPNEEKTLSFCVVWYFPVIQKQNDVTYRHFYAKRWDSLRDVLNSINKELPNLSKRWDQWRQMFTQTPLPGWFTDHLFNGLGILTTHGVLLEDKTFALRTADTKYPGNLGSPEEWLASYSLLAQCYPELLISQLSLIQSSQLQNGEIPSAIGNIYTDLGIERSAARFYGRPDSASAFILMMYEYGLLTGDQAYFETITPAIKKAIVWLLDIIEENQDDTPDGPNLWQEESQGVFLLTADLWLTALRICEEAAIMDGDLELQTLSNEWKNQAANHIASQLWNGRFFTSWFNPYRLTASTNAQLIPGLMPGTAAQLRLGWKRELGEPKILSTFQTMANYLASPGVDEFDFYTISSHMIKPIHTAFVRSFTASSLIRMGYPNAGMRLIEATTQHEPYADAGVWSAYAALTGTHMDMNRECFIIGPSLPHPWGKITLPFFTPILSGTVHLKHSNRNPLKQYEITIQNLHRQPSIQLKQLAFNPTGLDSIENHRMRVFHNGTLLAGQDYMREQLKVFELRFPIHVRKNDTILITLSEPAGAVLRADLADKLVTNLGAICSIQTRTPSSPGLSFQVNNLLPEKQEVSVELFNKGEQDYLVFIDGERYTTPAESLQSIPLLLDIGQISQHTAAKIKHLQSACSEAVRFLSTRVVPGELKERLWELQEATDKALALDSTIRGVRIDIIPSDVANPNPNYEPPAISENVEQEFERIDELTQAFYDELDNLTNNPILAAKVKGFFVPLTFNITNEPIKKYDQTVQLNIRVGNPLQIPVLINRINFELPSGWQVGSSDDLKIDDLTNPQSEHTISVTLHPSNNVWAKRYPAKAVFSGRRDDFPFHREINFAIGHDFIKEWLVIGPFSNANGEGIHKVVKPEINVKLDEAYEGLGKTIKWKSQTFPEGYVDFDSVFDPDDYAMGYAYVGVYSPRQQRARFEFGCNGDIKVFQNYRPVYEKRSLRQPAPSSEIVYTDLNQGWNHIIVKVCESTGPWGFYFEIADGDGLPMPELSYSLEKAD